MYKSNYKKGKAFIFIFIILATIFTGAIVFQKKTVCDSPLKYSIGTIDSRFDISRNDFTKLAQEGSAVWEKGTGINLFKYDKNSKFKINLIFDKRQQNTIAEKRSREILNNKNASYNMLIEKLKILKVLYKKQLGEYKRAVSMYKSNLDKYNKTVLYWNNQGGAPQVEFSKLEQKRLDLQNTKLKFTVKMSKLNILNKKINTIIKEINGFTDKLNSQVNTYNKTFGKAKIFDQGEYTGKGINIYQFDNRKDLRIVLAHELGHALNLKHTTNPKSIMYYLMGKQNVTAPSLSKEDVNALKTECGIK